MAAFPAAIASAASILPFNSPDPSYLAATTLLPITAADGTPVSSLTAGPQTLNISAGSIALSVPGGGWDSWSAPPDAETSTPRVLANSTSFAVTLNLALGASIFGLEAQPNFPDFFTITADFYDGAKLLGSISRSITGDGGARLFAGQAVGGQITSVVVSSDWDFGLAQFRYRSAANPIPEPSTWTFMLACSLVLLGAKGRNFRL